MRMIDTTVRRRLALTGGIALAICLAGSPALAGFEESKTFTSDQLVINNLIGEIHVQGHGGSSFEVVVKVDGRDASRESIELRSDGDQLSVVFPISDEELRLPTDGSGLEQHVLTRSKGLVAVRGS